MVNEMFFFLLPRFFEIFEKYDGYKHGHVKLKRPKQLQEILGRENENGRELNER